jgi:3-(methylthio)propanoyl-CoA dehydrogenase
LFELAKRFMTFIPALNDQRFVLETIANLDTLIDALPAETATTDMVEAILVGASDFALKEWAPLNRIGDTQGAQWRDGSVRMPDGFRDSYARYVESGWGTLSAPIEYGGQALPHLLQFAVMEHLGTANMAFGLCPILTAGAIDAVTAHGSDAQKKDYLPNLIAGLWTGTMNLTESGAGSDVGAIRTMAVSQSDGSYSISGTKMFISFGEHDLTENIIHLVLARTPNAPQSTKGLSMFIVPKHCLDQTPNGLRCSSIEHKLGIHASPTCVMNFGDGAHCRGWLIGKEFSGLQAMFTMMNSARLFVGLQGVQIAERATQAAVAYAKVRIQGKPIIDHPDVRRMLIRMKALTEGARAIVYFAASQIDLAKLGVAGAQQRLNLLTPLAKAWATDIGCEVASLGIQVHGGMGYAEETGAAQHYRDARIAPIYEGTNGIQAADFIGRKLLADKGQGLAAILSDIRKEAISPSLLALVDAVEDVATWMLDNNEADRLAGSMSFLTMAAVAVAGWLMERQKSVAQSKLKTPDGDSAFLLTKQTTADFFLAHIVPEALGLATVSKAGAQLLFAINAEQLAGA